MSGPILTSSRGAQIRPPLCFPLLPMPDEAGRLRFPDLESSVRQRLEVIIRTAPGEQLMRPYFGAGLERVIHQPNTVETRSALQRDIAAHVRAFEPRIVLDRIDVDAGEDPTVLMVTLSYRIRHLGVAATLSAAVPVGGN